MAAWSRCVWSGREPVGRALGCHWPPPLGAAEAALQLRAAAALVCVCPVAPPLPAFAPRGLCWRWPCRPRVCGTHTGGRDGFGRPPAGPARAHSLSLGGRFPAWAACAQEASRSPQLLSPPSPPPPAAARSGALCCSFADGGFLLEGPGRLGC